MTLAVDGRVRRDHGGLTRWGASLVVVLLLHATAGLYLLARPVPLDATGSPPPDAVMIDLPPLPAPTTPAPALPEPVVEPRLRSQPLVQSPPSPPEPDIPLPEVPLTSAPKPAVVLPKPPPKAKPRPVQHHPPQAEPERPPPPVAPTVSAPPAPATAPPAVNAGAARANWQAQLVGWLARYKRYPRLAQEQHQEGVVHLRFTMDRQGRVLSAQIDKGSGYSLLDEEVSALIQRAQPLPAPPPEVTGAQITLSLPVDFSLPSTRR